MTREIERPEAGHTFLASLGKRRLRPGGKQGTEWLLSHLDSKKPLRVLEVACNQGTTSFELVKRFNVEVVACDLSDDALEIAKRNAPRKNGSDRISFQIADARNLPFEDASFDIVINEAMLTMLSDHDKEKALSEYYRVLKPGGLVLTHDVLFRTDDTQAQHRIRQEMTRIIRANVKPLTQAEWVNLMQSSGFEAQSQSGTMSLMDPVGMIRDEGVARTLKIIRNAVKKNNRARFKSMIRLFKTHKSSIGYIAIVGVKPE